MTDWNEGYPRHYLVKYRPHRLTIHKYYIVDDKEATLFDIDTACKMVDTLRDESDNAFDHFFASYRIIDVYANVPYIVTRTSIDKYKIEYNESYVRDKKIDELLK